MDILSVVLDICLGAAAFKLAWSVDRTQKEMLKTQNALTLVQAQQATILSELTHRVAKLEEKVIG